jgi:hypothetical protein
MGLVDWIVMVQNRGKWQAFEDTVMNSQVP